MTTELKHANQAFFEARKIMAEQEKTLKKYRQELYSVYRSRSWRFTRPLRGTAEGIRYLSSAAFRPNVRWVLKKLYYLIPGFFRNTWFLEKMKNGFKEKEHHYSRQQRIQQDLIPEWLSDD